MSSKYTSSVSDAFYLLSGAVALAHNKVEVEGNLSLAFTVCSLAFTACSLPFTVLWSFYLACI